MNTKNNNFNLSETLISNLEHTARISKILAIRFFDENENINVSFHEFVIIDALHSFPNINQRDLAKKLYKGTANLSRDLEKLENRGLIKRNIEIRSKRVVKTLILTKEGEKVYQKVGFLAHEHISKIQSIFSKEEYEQFLFLILKLRDSLTESSDIIFE